MSPRDAVRMGDCIADGKAAGAQVDQVGARRDEPGPRQRRRTSRPSPAAASWGIIDGLPAEIKAQGPVASRTAGRLLDYDGNWHVNCLAVTESGASR